VKVVPAVSPKGADAFIDANRNLEAFPNRKFSGQSLALTEQLN
jgi:hypothetical protein